MLIFGQYDYLNGRKFYTQNPLINAKGLVFFVDLYYNIREYHYNYMIFE